MFKWLKKIKDFMYPPELYMSDFERGVDFAKSFLRNGDDPSELQRHVEAAHTFGTANDFDRGVSAVIWNPK